MVAYRRQKKKWKIQSHLQEKVFYELEAPTLVISVEKFRCLDMGGCLQEVVAPEGSNVVILIHVLSLV